MVKWVLARLGEKSTWKGIAVLLGLLGLNVGPEFVDALQSTGGLVVQAVLAVLSLIAMARKEKLPA